jgi:hypothetical protein
MRNNQRNRGSHGTNVSNVERNHQNRYYYANEDSDIYESEFQNEEVIYDDNEQHFGRDSVRDQWQDDHYEENDLDQQYRNAIDREEYEHQRSMGYISNNPKRLRKLSKRRYLTDAERDKRRRNHYIMENLSVTARR